MEIIDIFKQAVTKITLNENLNSLSDFCFKIKKEQKSRTYSNVGGFHCKDIK